MIGCELGLVLREQTRGKGLLSQHLSSGKAMGPMEGQYGRNKDERACRDIRRFTYEESILSISALLYSLATSICASRSFVRAGIAFLNWFSPFHPTATFYSYAVLISSPLYLQL